MKTIKLTYLLMAACLGILFTTGCASNSSRRGDSKCSYKKAQCPSNCDKPCCAKKKTCPPDCQKPCCKKK